MAADTLNPAVVQAMAEVAVDITGQCPKRLEVDAVQASDVVITTGCGDTCPVFPGKRYLDRTRDEIDHRVQELLRELTT